MYLILRVTDNWHRVALPALSAWIDAGLLDSALAVATWNILTGPPLTVVVSSPMAAPKLSRIDGRSSFHEETEGAVQRRDVPFCQQTRKI